MRARPARRLVECLHPDPQGGATEDRLGWASPCIVALKGANNISHSLFVLYK